MPERAVHERDVKTLAALCAPGAERAARGLDAGEWRRALALARLNRVAAPMAKNLARLGLLELAPENTRAELASIPRSAAAANMLILDSARAILAAACDAGVDMIPLKGALYAELFGATDEREMSDADFLVRRVQLGELGAFMRGLGWKRAESNLPETFIIEYSGEMKFTTDRAGVRVNIETQWNPSQSLFAAAAYNLDGESLWAMARMEPGAPSLPPEAVILYHIHHMAAVHSFSRLQWILDLAPLCAALKPDWNKLSALLSDSGLSRAASMAFFLSSELFGAPSPPRSDFPSPGASPLFRATKDLIFKSIAGDAAVKRSGAVSMLLAERRAAPLFQAVFPPAKYLAFRYPAVPAPLRRPYRAANLISKLVAD
jgi:hypothetical protein